MWGKETVSHIEFQIIYVDMPTPQGVKAPTPLECGLLVVRCLQRLAYRNMGCLWRSNLTVEKPRKTSPWPGDRQG